MKILALFILIVNAGGLLIWEVSAFINKDPHALIYAIHSMLWIIIAAIILATNTKGAGK